MRQSGRYNPVFLFARAYEGMRRDQAVCQSEAIRFVSDRLRAGGEGEAGGLSRGAEAAPPHAAPSAFRRVLRAWWLNPPFVLGVARALVRQGQELALARRIVAREQPDLLVLAEDNVGYETAVLIRAVHERNVPAVVIPFTVSNALEPAEWHFRDPAHHVEGWSSRLVAALYPRWVYEHRGRRMLRLPAAQVIAKQWWGLAPPIPWQMNSGSADAIAVESPFMEAYYRREGLPAGPLVVTGTLADDELAAVRREAVARREALCAELDLPRDRRLVLCAIPPDQFALCASQADLPDYQTLLRVWVDTLTDLPGCTVVVRLHPRMAFEAFRHIEAWGVRISQRDTASLVPLCDLFVASVSATIRWAIACGKPVLNYDVYRLGWTDFQDAPGVLRVETRADFAATARRLADDPSFYDEVRRRQEGDAPRWGRLDGQARRRILDCLDAVRVRGGRAQ
jgi:hypothetical protein